MLFAGADVPDVAYIVAAVTDAARHILGEVRTDHDRADARADLTEHHEDQGALTLAWIEVIWCCSLKRTRVGPPLCSHQMANASRPPMLRMIHRPAAANPARTNTLPCSTAHMSGGSARHT